MVDVREGQVWRDCGRGEYWVVLKITPRMAVIHSSDSLGRRKAGFTLNVRHASLRREYELVPSQGGNEEKA